jgi:NPH3 family
MQHHSSLSEQQKEKICQLIDIRRLSQEACRDVVRNEKLPLRVVVKVLFIELLHLKTSLDEPGTETLIETELRTEIRTENEISNTRRMDLLWQRMKLHNNYEIFKKLIKRVEKTKMAKKNWKLIFCRNFGSIRIGRALPASRGQ